MSYERTYCIYLSITSIVITKGFIKNRQDLIPISYSTILVNAPTDSYSCTITVKGVLNEILLSFVVGILKIRTFEQEIYKKLCHAHKGHAIIDLALLP